MLRYAVIAVALAVAAAQEWDGQTCNCGIFIQAQFPDTLGGPFRFLNDTQVSVSCSDDAAKANSECNEACAKSAQFFAANFNLAYRPDDTFDNPNPFNNTAGELFCGRIFDLTPELLPVEKAPLQGHRRLPICDGIDPEVGWNVNSSYVAPSKLCCDQDGGWVQECN